MPYATETDLTTRYGADELVQLTDDTGTGTADPAKIAAALADADEAVNGYVAGRYAVPLSPVPMLVRRWSCDLARYFLHTAAVPELVEANYREAIKGLDAVAKGTITLAAAGAAQPVAPAADYSVMISTPGSAMDEFLRDF